MIIDQASLRDKAKSARASLSVNAKRKASDIIAERVCASQSFSSAKNICCYVPMPSEVDTWPIIRRAWAQNKRIFAPVVKKNFQLEFRELGENSDLSASKLGMNEPLSGKIATTEELDLVLAPLVAFDMKRNRIGMGGGYYDRAFEKNNLSAFADALPIAGLAFDVQLVDEIASNPWDVRLSQIFTETLQL